MVGIRRFAGYCNQGKYRRQNAALSLRTVMWQGRNVHSQNRKKNGRQVLFKWKLSEEKFRVLKK